MADILIRESDLIKNAEGENVARVEANKIILEDGAGGGYSYSTDEKKVGKWIDGKDLYQKTFYKERAEATGGYENIGNIEGIVVNVSGQLTRECAGVDYIYPISTVEDNNYYFMVRIDDGVVRSHATFNDANRIAKDLIITVQYIKEE